jgi:hypothetical protein
MIATASALRAKLPLEQSELLQIGDGLPDLFAFSEAATKVPLESFQTER